MRKLVLVLFVVVAVLAAGTVPVFAGSTNPATGQVPAFYDDVLHTINLKLLGQASATLLAHNKSVNHIFMSDTPLPGGVPFINVIDAIQGDGFNPLWQEVNITFVTIPPQQFTSDTAILAAADAGQISLTFENRVDRCSVVGEKK